MANPPQHRADAPIIFVGAQDPAWDDKRIGEELGGLSGEALASHIVPAYLRGDTRGDKKAIDAEGRTIEDYLDGSQVEVVCKRLSIVDVARCRDQSPRMGRLGAAKLAYAGDFNELVDQHGAEFVFDLGEFALRCSEAPRPGESKRSGS